MNRSLLAGVLAIVTGLGARPAAAQVDPARTRIAAVKLDTNRIRFQRPVSRVVMEATWATVDTQPKLAGTAVLARPAWSSQAVLYKRVSQPITLSQAPAIRIMSMKVAARPAPPPSAAEDSTITRQKAADFRTRAEAVSRVNAVAVTRLHPMIAANLISELDSVGVARFAVAARSDAQELAPEEEGYSEYIVDLARAVVRLKDPRSVRALALGGLSTSREAQRFVAEQGTAGLAVLDTAFAGSESMAPAVVTTWGYSLAASPSRLSFPDSVYIYARILLSAQLQPVAFAFAARTARLFDLRPELDSLAAGAAADSSPAVAGAARAATRILTEAETSATSADWLSRLRLRTGVLCMDETRIGAASCRTLLDATTAAGRSLRTPAGVGQAMGQYTAELDAAVQQRRISAEMRARLTPLVNGLLRTAGARRALPPVVRPGVIRPGVIRP